MYLWLSEAVERPAFHHVFDPLRSFSLSGLSFCAGWSTFGLKNVYRNVIILDLANHLALIIFLNKFFHLVNQTVDKFPRHTTDCKVVGGACCGGNLCPQMMVTRGEGGHKLEEESYRSWLSRGTLEAADGYWLKKKFRCGKSSVRPWIKTFRWP